MVTANFGVFFVCGPFVRFLILTDFYFRKKSVISDVALQAYPHDACDFNALICKSYNVILKSFPPFLCVCKVKIPGTLSWAGNYIDRTVGSDKKTL